MAVSTVIILVLILSSISILVCYIALKLSTSQKSVSDYSKEGTYFILDESGDVITNALVGVSLQYAITLGRSYHDHSFYFSRNQEESRIPKWIVEDSVEGPIVYTFGSGKDKDLK